MSSKRIKRISSEIANIEKDRLILEESGIYFYYDESNMNIIYAMILGPSDTPYDKGFYFFKFEYPENYPMQPPIAKYCTQGILPVANSKSYFNVRFNPNLYVCGKVCLSMLNTWSGPGWVPTNTISNVMIAIQALVLNDDPLRNEPGFENAPKKELQRYNDIISYANIKISVLGMIENTPIDFLFFIPKMKEIFLKNSEYYINFVLKCNDTKQNPLFESPAYSMKTIVNYGQLVEELVLMQVSLTEELNKIPPPAPKLLPLLTPSEEMPPLDLPPGL